MKLKFNIFYVHLLLIMFSIVFSALFSKMLLDITLLFPIIIFTLTICIMLICFKAFEINLDTLTIYFIFLFLLVTPLIFNKEYCFRLVMKIPFDISPFLDLLGFLYLVIIKPFNFLFEIICKLGLVDYRILIVPCFLIFLYFISKKIIE